MENQGAEHHCRAMLASLGGSAEPVLYTLGRQQPEYILFFESAESAGQIQGIIRELPYQCRDYDVRPEFNQKYHDVREGKLRLPLFAAYRLLNAHGDELGQRFVARRQEEILKLLSLRNLSPLGHGENLVGQEGYAQFRVLLVELFDIDESASPRFPELNLGGWHVPVQEVAISAVNGGAEGRGAW